MAKGQKRTNKETRKPKKGSVKPLTATTPRRTLGIAMPEPTASPAPAKR
jgi:hypothetical protein